jgi:TonB-dependent receptor
MKRILSVATILLFILTTFAQNSGINGVVTDQVNSEAIPFTFVMVVGDDSKRARTDFDGKYQLNLAPGDYKIGFTCSSYGKTFVEVTVIANEYTTVDQAMSSSAKSIKEFVITVEAKAATSIAAIDNTKKEASGAMDGSGAQQMKDQGDSDAGDAMKRVTGVSMKGQDVYVRGLGDKYTKTTLNTMGIPGLDPDKNSVQMDIFPTNLIDNIMVYKTFSPELYGDFSGGLVDITTKDLPRKKVLSFSAGLGYNTVTTMNSNFILYDKGRTDFLGFDDGSRALPISSTKNLPDPTVGDPELTRATKSFGQQMAVAPSMAFMNQNYSFGIGNVKDSLFGKKVTYGYNFYANYKNEHNYFGDVVYSAYRKDPDASVTELFPNRISTGQMGQQNVMWSTLFAQTFKFNKDNKVTLNMFHTQNGISEAASLTDINYETNPATLEKQSLQYTQRSVSTLNLNGKHTLNNEAWKVNWAVAPSLSRMSNPDIRSTVLEKEDFTDENGDPVYSLNQSVGGEIRRIFRNLTELNLNSKADFEYGFARKSDSTLTSKIKFGAAQSYKTRTFRVYDYVFNLENVTESIPNDPNWFFQEENIWTPESDQGTYASGERELANSFDATQLVIGTYVMNDLPVTKKFRAVYGVRMETAINKYTGQNNDGSVQYNNATVLNETSFLPAVNLTYVLHDVMADRTNLRASYTQTLARPSFKEKSIAQIYDPIQGRTFNGNIDLMQTNIHNMDLRWEKFYGRTEVLSASAFYKKFINPIELVSFATSPNDVQPTNSGEANMYGFELEARKRIGFTAASKSHKKFYVGANFTYIKTQIDMNLVLIGNEGNRQSEREIRQANARDGETIGNYRTMYGQSPYLVNAFTSFANDSLGMKLNLSYNVQGKQLAVIGIGALPDVFDKPFHSLNLKASKAFGADHKWNASINIQNILNNKRVRYYESFQATDQIYDYFNLGRTISASISYTLK